MFLHNNFNLLVILDSLVGNLISCVGDLTFFHYRDVCVGVSVYVCVCVCLCVNAGR